MLKCLALLRKKPELSREQFIDYYEKRHAPLIRRLLPQICEYRRNFIDLSDAVLVGGVPDFDAVTELWFEARAAYEGFRARSAEPEIARQIADDEENLFDRSTTRLFLVEEYGAPAAPPPR